MGTIKLGIIGTGFGAEVHVPIFSLHKGFEVQAIASVHRGVTDTAGRNLPAAVRLYSDWRQMLEQEDLDMVSITSSPDLHFEMTMYALKKGIHVLCEKPMGLNAKQSQQMVREQDRCGLQGYVNFQWRLTPVRQRIKDILLQHALGDVQHIKYEGSFSGYKGLTSAPRGWEARRASGGGMLFAVGSHMIDSLMWWMGQRIVTVSAELSTYVPIYDGQGGVETRDADDAFTVRGSFQNGTTFNMDLFYPAVQGNGWLLEVFGTKGTLRMKNDQEIAISFGGGYEELEVESCEVPSSLAVQAQGYYNGFSQMADSIYQSWQGTIRMNDIPTFEDGHQVQLVLDAIQLSSAEGRQVTIQY